MLNKENAIRMEKQPRKSGGPRTIFVFQCDHAGCRKEIKVRTGNDLLVSSGKCGAHSHVKRPFESIYNSLKNDWRKTPVELSYEDFLDFTKHNACHYCTANIPWVEFGTVDGEFISRSYFLDRKDNEGSYSVQNCVVCCTRCNRAKGNRYSYEEWYGMTTYFRDKNERHFL